MSSVHKLIADYLFRYTDGKVTVADFGCGDGFLTKFLPDNKIKKYVGSDVNQDSIQLAKMNFKRRGKYTFYHIAPGSTNYFTQPSEFDAIILIGVLQYLSKKEIAAVFVQAKKALKPGGLLLLSCTVDHLFYKVINIYGAIYPHNFIKKEMVEWLYRKVGFKILENTEKGLFFTPFFSNVLVFFFDAADFMLFRKKGSLGPFGKWARRLAEPIIAWEYTFKVNFGYCLIMVGKNV